MEKPTTPHEQTDYDFATRHKGMTEQKCYSEGLAESTSEEYKFPSRNLLVNSIEYSIYDCNIY